MVKLDLELISSQECKLFETIQVVKYGELYGVEVESGPKWIEYDLSPPMRSLLEYIRDGGQYIDILTIHNGQPAMAETDLKINGFRCRRKVRFSTI